MRSQVVACALPAELNSAAEIKPAHPKDRGIRDQRIREQGTYFIDLNRRYLQPINFGISSDFNPEVVAQRMQLCRGTTVHDRFGCSTSRWCESWGHPWHAEPRDRHEQRSSLTHIKPVPLVMAPGNSSGNRSCAIPHWASKPLQQCLAGQGSSETLGRCTSCWLPPKRARGSRRGYLKPVSYTHLTLPTKA